MVRHRLTLEMPRRSCGFTLIELMVIIAIVGILSAMLFPLTSRAREAAKRTTCLSNEKQIALGASIYANDFDDQMPPAASCVSTSAGVYACQFWWYGVTNDYQTTPVLSLYAASDGLLQPYLQNREIDGCPTAHGMVPIGGPGGPPQGIAENILAGVAPLSTFDSPASTIMLADQGILYGAAGHEVDYARPVFFVYSDEYLPCMEGRHAAGSLNTTWFDGHARSEKIGIGDYATNNDWGIAPTDDYIAALGRRNVGWVFPPGVRSAKSDPKFNCYYMPIDRYVPYPQIMPNLVFTRPSDCAE